MAETIAALVEQQDELSGLIADLEEQEWELASRCAGWSVADVVLHLAQTNELAIGSARGRFPEAMDRLTAGLPPAGDIDEGAALMVERDRAAWPDVRDRWLMSAQVLREALKSCPPSERVIWVAGELSARTLATTRLAETWIHTGDVAEALGVALVPGDRLQHVARLAWRTLPYAFERAGRSLSGTVAFDLVGPHGDRWLLAADAPAATTITGLGVELCLVAARRVAPDETSLSGTGPDVDAVLDLVRTYA